MSNINTLGRHLSILRASKSLTLRQVEEMSNKEVSNAYLSQLEHGKIRNPSPNILLVLSKIYDADYSLLMKEAGYQVDGNSLIVNNAKISRTNTVSQTYSIGGLSKNEEEELLSYLTYFRSKQK